MNLAQISGAIGLQLIDRLLSSGTLTMYSGTMPVSPETALSGNTALCAWTFSATPFGAPVLVTGTPNVMAAPASFVNASETPTANGTVTFARATLNASAWAGSTNYAYGNIRSNSGGFYLCVGGGVSASSGGPTATTEGITDGAATWNYIGPTSGQGNVVMDYSVGTSGADIIVSTTSFNTGAAQSISSFNNNIPVV